MTTPRPARRRVTQLTTDAASDAADAGHATLWDAAPVNAPALPDDAPRTIVRDSLYDTHPPRRAGARPDRHARVRAACRASSNWASVYRVWPGATHTRFEHSLGVYYLMLRALRSLWARTRWRAIARSTTDLRTMLAAALLHDIGHYPFSHAIEELGYPDRAARAGRAAHHRAQRIADVLERHGSRPSAWPIWSIRRATGPLPASDALLVRLLSGSLDVDKLDYLPRDARACNVPYGGVDVTRLLGSLRVLETRGSRGWASATRASARSTRCCTRGRRCSTTSTGTTPTAR